MLAKLDLEMPKITKLVYKVVEERLQKRGGADEKNLALSIAQLYQCFEGSPELVPESLLVLLDNKL